MHARVLVMLSLTGVDSSCGATAPCYYCTGLLLLKESKCCSLLVLTRFVETMTQYSVQLLLVAIELLDPVIERRDVRDERE